MAPHISVIIPNYNHAPYLEQRIESVLKQTFQDMEVIILDDCSTDSSQDIIEWYRDHPLVHQILYNDENSGNTFKQWRKGIEHARGEWIWVAESDDWCEPTFLEEVFPDPTDPDSQNVVLSYCGSLMYRDNDILHYPAIKHMLEVLDGDSYVKAQMGDGNEIYNASSCIFRRDAYHNCPPHEQFTYSGDWFIWINIALQGRVRISGKCLNYFRKHSNDVSSKSQDDGTSYREYVTMQKWLLDNRFINIDEYETNLLNTYLSYKHKISKNNTQAVYTTYKQHVYLFNIKLIKFKLLRYIKRIARF